MREGETREVSWVELRDLKEGFVLEVVTWIPDWCPYTYLNDSLPIEIQSLNEWSVTHLNWVG